mmetsp:Transcript_30776/g.69201  ORF Transcript_30776/g.69201 Transcript_30776/m.69201 type:complete len:226 (-) Transcript_30776:533-1210(-)
MSRHRLQRLRLHWRRFLRGLERRLRWDLGSNLRRLLRWRLAWKHRARHGRSARGRSAGGWSWLSGNGRWRRSWSRSRGRRGGRDGGPGGPRLHGWSRLGNLLRGCRFFHPVMRRDRRRRLCCVLRGLLWLLLLLGLLLLHVLFSQAGSPHGHVVLDVFEIEVVVDVIIVGKEINAALVLIGVHVHVQHFFEVIEAVDVHLLVVQFPKELLQLCDMPSVGLLHLLV